VNHHPLHYRRIAAIATVLLVVVAVGRSDVLHHALIDILTTAGNVIRTHPRAGVVLFLCLSALSSMLSFFSSAALVPVGVFVWGTEKTAFLLWLGGVSGGSAGYWFARTLGRRVVKRLVPAAPFRRYETFFRTQAHWRTILLFRVALQSELPSYVLGVLRYSFTRYFPMIVLAELPYVLLVVYLGDAFLKGNSLFFAGALAIGILLTVQAFRTLQREMRAS
jgi:uncharacterized membrane protein YdjX (TVP38/TMEM64 family)